MRHDLQEEDVLFLNRSLVYGIDIYSLKVLFAVILFYSV